MPASRPRGREADRLAVGAGELDLAVGERDDRVALAIFEAADVGVRSTAVAIDHRIAGPQAARIVPKINRLAPCIDDRIELDHGLTRRVDAVELELVPGAGARRGEVEGCLAQRMLLRVCELDRAIV